MYVAIHKALFKNFNRMLLGIIVQIQFMWRQCKKINIITILELDYNHNKNHTNIFFLH
jgi:hypothetical protein